MTDSDIDLELLRAEMADLRQSQVVCPRCGYAFVFRIWPVDELKPSPQLDAMLDGLSELVAHDPRVTIYACLMLFDEPLETTPVQVWRANDRRLVATTQHFEDFLAVLEAHSCPAKAASN